MKGPGGKTIGKGERRLANRTERERHGKAFLEVRACDCSARPRPIIARSSLLDTLCRWNRR
eukprot:COSAG06_NODE_1764_length_8447_cov_10.337087_6_plen_61_part_00